MTQFVIANNVDTQLATAASSTATTLTLASSANLPTLSAGQQMPLTLNDAATGLIYEVVYVTAISGVTLTVTRAQEGTGAQNWNIGDYAFCAPTKGTVAVTTGNPSNTFMAANATAANMVPNVGQVQAGSANYAVATGTANAHTVALTPALTARTDGMLLRYKAPAANTGAVTLADGVGTANVIGANHAALQGGEYIANGDALVVWNSTINSGTYILLECTGGALQVAPATASQHAMQLGQATGRLLRISLYSNNGTAQTVSVNGGTATTTGAGSWTPLAATNNFRVKVQAPGGGGGGGPTTSSSQNAAGAGGAGGGYAESFLAVTAITAPVAITAPAPPGNSTTNGASGGTASFGSYASATGGAGGQVGVAATSSILQGPLGGAGSGGNLLNVAGNPGGPGIVTAVGAAVAGNGGSSMLGAGGRGGAAQGTPGGTGGSGFGGGGAGTCSPASTSTALNAGAAGAPAIIIEEYA